MIRKSDSGETSPGIKVLAGIIGLCAAVPAVVGLAMAAETGIVASELGSLAIAGLVLAIGLVGVLVAAGLCIGFYGAWWVAIVLYAGSAVGGTVTGISIVGPSALVSAAVSALIAGYLYKCRDQFESDLNPLAEL